MNVLQMKPAEEIDRQSSLYREIYARDLGVCALCGLDCVALKVALQYIESQWDEIACVPLHLSGLMKAFSIAGQPRGASKEWARSNQAERLRHPEFGLKPLGQDLVAIRLALGIGLTLKPLTFDSWRSELGVWARRYPKGLWDKHHRIPRSREGSDKLENLMTLCLGCHEVETKKGKFGAHPQGA